MSPSQTTPTPLVSNDIHTLPPNLTPEPTPSSSLRRRSLRLSSTVTAIRVFNNPNPTVLNLRSGKSVIKRGIDRYSTLENRDIGSGSGSDKRCRKTRKEELVVTDSVVDEVKLVSEFEMEEGGNGKRGKRKNGGSSSQKGCVNGNVGEGSSQSRMRLSTEEKGKAGVIDGDVDDDVVVEGVLGEESEMKELDVNRSEYNVAFRDREGSRNSNGSRWRSSRRSLSKEGKGKELMVGGDLSGDVVEIELGIESEIKDSDLNGSEDNVAFRDREGSRNSNDSMRSSRRSLSKEGKGKELMVDGDLSGDVVEGELGIESEIKDSDVNGFEDNVAFRDREGSRNSNGSRRRSSRRSLSKEGKGKELMVDGDLSGDVVEIELGIESEIKDSDLNGSEDNVALRDREGSRNSNGSMWRSSRRSLSKEGKGKELMVDGDLSGDVVVEGELGIESEIKDSDVNGSEDNVALRDREGSRNSNSNAKEHGSRSSSSSRRSLSNEGKGKAVMVDDDLSGDVGEIELGVETEIKDSDVNRSEDNVALHDRERSSTREHGSRRNVNTNAREHGSRRNVSANARERFRDIARENASRFAYFNLDGSDDGRPCPEQPEVEPEIEDWPGPFSTAMKIIKDRVVKSVKTGGDSVERSLVDSIKWVPKTKQGDTGASFPVPPLQELCLKILAKNVDAIVSLDSVPDALRHKLSQLLCDSRKINGHFFELLVSGSPTEIRLRDCSWLTEEQFTTSFQMSDTANLVVLQLDQCGRCLPDYVILATLAQSPRNLPRLTSLSLSGACRLSDGGLRALISSAPALRSINLSLCSLLTSSSVYILAESLKSLLKELYLDDCQGIDASLIVPALVELEHLQVLSVAGIQTVGDEFIKDYIIARGHNLKELVLKDCINLTDASIKVIAEHCAGLCVLDLTNLYKLTDLSIGYLTNGCHALHTLKLCRNPFSDEAIAAFVETTGESLKELSLNNVKKVGYHTTLSLANHAKNVHTLDLSWCRNLTDNALGLIVDSCLSLRLLKLFGCTQVTDVFLNGHSNLQIQIIGLKMSPVLQHVKVPDPHQAALNYSSVCVNLA